MQGCDHGVGGAKYRTPIMVFDNAFMMLDVHLVDCHGVHGEGGWGGAAEGEEGSN